jgi:hypothetical protein
VRALSGSQLAVGWQLRDMTALVLSTYACAGSSVVHVLSGGWPAVEFRLCGSWPALVLCHHTRTGTSAVHALLVSNAWRCQQWCVCVCVTCLPVWCTRHARALSPLPMDVGMRGLPEAVVTGCKCCSFFRTRSATFGVVLRIHEPIARASADRES